MHLNIILIKSLLLPSGGFRMFRRLIEWILIAGCLGAVSGEFPGTDTEPRLPAPMFKIGDCPRHELRQEDSIIANVRCNLNQLTEVYRKYRIVHPGSVGILKLTLTILSDGSIASAETDSSTFSDTAFLSEVSTAARAWQFCPVDETSGNQVISFQVSFADRNGMVRSLLQETDDLLMKKNFRLFKKWCGDTVRKSYRRYLAFKGPAHGTLDFKVTGKNGWISSIVVTGGSLAHHPIRGDITASADQLVGKRFRGSAETDSAYFTLLLLDLRAAVTVFDGKMEYRNSRGWYYTDPLFPNYTNIPQWKPPSLPVGF